MSFINFPAYQFKKVPPGLQKHSMGSPPSCPHRLRKAGLSSSLTPPSRAASEAVSQTYRGAALGLTFLFTLRFLEFCLLALICCDVHFPDRGKTF